MLKCKIDNKEVEVAPGTTVLEALRAQGIDVPALCYLQTCTPNTSCMACVVKIDGRPNFVASCATAVRDGMVIESETDEIRQVRRTALELLLSDHLGDCMAPCHCVCPANMNIPLMIRQIAAGQLADAVVTVKNDIALPAVLGRICPAPCEAGCRRKQHDAPVSICLLKRTVADVDLAAPQPYRPQCAQPSGKRVAIVGGGPTGLAAAYYLRRAGHAAVVFDDRPAAGGMLRYGVERARLAENVLDAEIATIAAVGAEIRSGVRVGRDVNIDDLLRDYDAVFAAPGVTTEEQAGPLKLPWAAKVGVKIDRRTYRTAVAKLFAACSPRQQKMAVRAVADGKAAAAAIDQFVRGLAVTGERQPFTCHIGKPKDGEMAAFLAEADARPRVVPAAAAAGFTPAEAVEECSRCLHCDCRRAEDCKLRKYAEAYGADPAKYKADRRLFEQDRSHTHVIYEPGKCIDCGLCVQITARAGERLGMAFINRGFKVRPRVPFVGKIEQGLEKVASEVVASCPTGALAFK